MVAAIVRHSPPRTSSELVMHPKIMSGFPCDFDISRNDEILSVCRRSCESGHIASTSIRMSPTNRLTYMSIATIKSAKFWLNPVALTRNLGFSPVELRKIQRMLRENEGMLLEKWYARFGR